MFKCSGHSGQKFTDWKMLRTGFLALAAFETVRGFSSRPGIDHIVIVILVPVVKDFLGIHAGKEVRDGDLLRASCRAVATGGAGNNVL